MRIQNRYKNNKTYVRLKFLNFHFYSSNLIHLNNVIKTASKADVDVNF